ncbi:arylsulfatase [Carboxylicivirga marina]|uniref:Arylsulfatase n=1 Tax=Carboxylicivirga marina TaxID=2800988 RepID=A0ABS1HIJ3_9BACT|nr:arylsulfatase [Carboxylicivirga marina]MBK3517494.1 arylsulfatase [Carboxylicivirga marina]
MRFFFLLLAFLLIYSQFLSAQNTKPNVILIITDDQGYGDIAALGNKIIKTPNMDKLYHEGIRFTNFHCGTTCAPSRSGLMSGADGNRAGVWHTIGGCNILREKFVTMPDVFKANGYATAMYGKWHLGDAYPYLPEDRGFDETVYHGAGGVGQTPDFWENDYFDDTYFRNGVPEKFEGYCSDVFFREAIDFIERKKEEPFFVYISTNAPHSPFNVEKKYYDIYKDETSITEKQKTFYGMITNIDDNMAILDKKLEELGLKDNTILIFTTDNGTATGVDKKDGVEYGFNAGMRGKKGSQYDGGHRVPLLVRWKDGKLVGGHDVNQLAMNYDMMPTLMNLCKLTKVPGPSLDGISLAPLMTKEVKEWPHRYCVVDNNRRQQPQKWQKSAVMDDEWRLINGKELYNIRKDIGQENNIAAQHPEKVKEMREAYEQWWDYTSRDFGHYEAYKIGVPHIDEHIITVHDLHTFTQVPWFQSHVRNPKRGKQHALAQGYWMIDVQQAGEYEITLSRWPRESGMGFSDTTPKLGEESNYYDAMPEGIVLDIEKATLSIEGLYLEQKVDMSQKDITFKAHLAEGRKQMQAYFTEKEGLDFAAFYLYIRKL